MPGASPSTNKRVFSLVVSQPSLTRDNTPLSPDSFSSLCTWRTWRTRAAMFSACTRSSSLATSPASSTLPLKLTTTMWLWSRASLARARFTLILRSILPSSTNAPKVREPWSRSTGSWAMFLVRAAQPDRANSITSNAGRAG